MGLTLPQHQAALAVAVGTPVAEVAEEIGFSRQAVYVWHGKPEFQAAVEQYRAVLVSAALGELVSATKAAVATLVELMSDRSQPGSVRLAAAREVLSRGGVQAAPAEPGSPRDARALLRQLVSPAPAEAEYTVEAAPAEELSPLQAARARSAALKGQPAPAAWSRGFRT